MRTILVLLLFVVSCASPGENSKPKTDLSTDEKVMAELNKGRKEPLEDGDVCIERPEEFKELILIGYFADDRGCMLGDAFYKGEKINLEKSDSQILMDNGWMDQSKRPDLAMAWVKNISTAWEYMLTEEPENFDTTGAHAFFAPEANLNIANGNISVVCWVQEPSGMAPENDFYQLLVVFSDKGAIVRSEIVDRYTEILP